MARIQSLDDLHITGPEWSLKHVQTVADCDRAEGALIEVLAKIERDVASDRFTNDENWKRSVVKVRTMRTQALEAVRARREMLRQDYQTLWNAQALVILQQLDPICFEHVKAATDELIGRQMQAQQGRAA